MNTINTINDDELYFPNLEFTYENHIDLGKIDGKKYLIEYSNYSDVYGDVVEFYSHYGAQIILFNYNQKPHTKKEVEEAKKFKKTHFDCYYGDEGAGIYLSTIDAIKHGYYKNVSYMTKEEIENKRKFLIEIQQKYMEKLLFCPHIEICDKDEVKKIEIMNETEYYLHNKNNTVLELYKIDNDKLIFFNYYKKPLSEKYIEHIKNSYINNYFMVNKNIVEIIKKYNENLFQEQKMILYSEYLEKQKIISKIKKNKCFCF
jgi:hypothetical protein